MDPKSWHYQRPRPITFHIMSLGLLIFLPFAMFSLVACLSSLVFQTLSNLVWSAIGLCQCIALLFIIVRPSRQGSQYWFILGVLCFLATVAGAASGLFNYGRNMYKYWVYEGQQTYTNVWSGTPALNHLDAGKIDFVSTSELDPSLSYAYFTAHHTYCITPIIDSLNRPTTIQYWAAGVDCCADNQFTCDSATNSTADQGLVWLDDPLFTNNNVAEFRQAATAAETSLGIKAAKDALFVRWVSDVNQAQETYRYNGITFLISSLISYMAFSMVVGFLIHFAKRSTRAKLEGRLP